MLVFFAVGNAKLLSFAFGDTKLPNTNGFESQWNIGLTYWSFDKYIPRYINVYEIHITDSG